MDASEYIIDKIYFLRFLIVLQDLLVVMVYDMYICNVLSYRCIKIEPLPFIVGSFPISDSCTKER